tara:strand:+ start:189 stop:398 length:210 start_codon:yes stop_codon:yes gene_type:complete
MTISIESVKKYAEGLKADLFKARATKEQAIKSANEADNQIKVIDGALQFANLLLEEAVKEDSKEKTQKK